jgi:hypothetical protein
MDAFARGLKIAAAIRMWCAGRLCGSAIPAGTVLAQGEAGKTDLQRLNQYVMQRCVEAEQLGQSRDVENGTTGFLLGLL